MAFARERTCRYRFDKWNWTKRNSYRSRTEWDTHKGIIQNLYINRNLRVKDIVKIMAETYGFSAT